VCLGGEQHVGLRVSGVCARSSMGARPSHELRSCSSAACPVRVTPGAVVAQPDTYRGTLACAAHALHAFAASKRLSSNTSPAPPQLTHTVRACVSGHH
jgi:hypothetical protein